MVAEGVERPAQLEFLAECGPLGVQGYLLAHPVEAVAAATEAQAAGERARRLLESAVLEGRRNADDHLVFVGSTGRRRRT